MIDCDANNRLFGIILEVENNQIKTIDWIPCSYMPQELLTHGLKRTVFDPFLLLQGATKKANYTTAFIEVDCQALLDYYANGARKSDLSKTAIIRLQTNLKIGAKPEKNKGQSMQDNLRKLVAAVKLADRAGDTTTESQAVMTLLSYANLIIQIIEYHRGTDINGMSTIPDKVPIPIHMAYLQVNYDTEHAIVPEPEPTEAETPTASKKPKKS